MRTFGFRRSGARPLVLGHRGASAFLPENSIEAFRRAMADGADGVELDVTRCKTGEVVVFHDGDLRRLGGRPGRITELPLSELRCVRLLSGASIPTLDEALEACGPDALVNVELKAPVMRPASVALLVDAVSRCLERAGAARRVLVSSFNPFALWLWRHQQPSIRSALLIEPPVRTGWTLPFLGAAAVNPDAAICSEAAVAAWHNRGYAVNVWTVDEPAQVRTLAGIGVDGLISNDPGRTRAILDELAADVNARSS